MQPLGLKVWEQIHLMDESVPGPMIDGSQILGHTGYEDIPLKLRLTLDR